MYAQLVKKARANRLAALAALAAKRDNVVSFADAQARRSAADATPAFVSIRTTNAPIRVAA
ncbi:MAG: hypothetical protein QNJ16_06450 [Rhodobacter sp.]|nr:hypothetical protein [Rhodobacter sp.]